MLKCKNCGKIHLNMTAKHCSDCGSKFEQEIESLLPQKAVKSLKRNSIIYILSLSVAIIIISVLAFLTVGANNSIKEQRDIVSGLNLDLTKKGNEMTALQNTLNKTEAGRKQIEAAKALVDDQNKQLDTRATSAEQTASQAKSDLAKTQSDLSTRQAELASTNAQLAKSQRGIAKFDQLNSLFNSYSSSAGRFTTLLGNAWSDLNANILTNQQYYQDQMTIEINNLNSYQGQINTIFTSIKSGNY